MSWFLPSLPVILLEGEEPEASRTPVSLHFPRPGKVLCALIYVGLNPLSTSVSTEKGWDMYTDRPAKEYLSLGSTLAQESELKWVKN